MAFSRHKPIAPSILDLNVLLDEDTSRILLRVLG
jgi:hypothetical protein